MHKKSFLPLGLLVLATIISGAVLASSFSSAIEETVGASVTVSSACTMFRESTVPHVATGFAGNYYQDIGTTRLNTMCNDKDGYAIYAIGYSNDTDGDTNMYGEEHNETIPTGTETGDVSNWSMKLTKDLESYNPENLTIISPYNNYAAVPSTQTKVASFTGATDTTKGSVVETTYAVRVSPTQLADTYVGQVKYTMVHPADGRAPGMMAIQDITAENCPTTPTVVYDIRDDEEYTIQKLADGNCWLLDNLRLDLTDSDVQANLTSNTTNASDTTLGYLKNGGGTASDPYATASVARWTTSIYSFSAPLINTSDKNTTGSNGYAAGKYGIYYNFCAASAGSYCYGNNTSPGTSVGDAEEDICPSGWRLPTGGNSGELKALYTAYNSVDSDYINALRVPFSGYYYSGEPGGRNQNGDIWASTRNSERNMTRLYASSSTVDPQDYSNRIYGLSVRCIANTSESSGPSYDPSKTYIQDVTPETCPTERTLVYDKRDEEPYYIQQITSNGETLCWMTSNLNIAGGTKLTSELTNMRPGEEYTLPESNNVGFSDYTVPQLYNSGNNDCSSTPCTSYYNYIVATLNKSVPAQDTAEYDICPKSWRLPVNTEFENLLVDYGNSLTSAPWYSSSAGMYTGGGPNVNAGGSTGFYWAGNTSMASGVYPYALFASSTPSGGSMSSFAGFSIRCVAKTPVPEGKIYIQDVSLATCPNERTLVYDKRDEKQYYIQKITTESTSLCWMTSNLDIAGGTKLTSTLTNLEPGTTHVLPASSMSGFDIDYPDEYVYNTGRTDCIDNNNPCYSYYSHHAAAPSIYINSGDVEYDICPSGWRLPTRNEYTKLMHEYNTSYALLNSPWNGVYSGQIYEGSFRNVGGLGRYWTSEVRNSGQGAYTFLFMTANSITMSALSRGRGAAIRCVSKEAGAEKIYLQDVSVEECPYDPTTVYDKRDGEEYTIQKLEDGNCWMLENLRLDPANLETKLTPENTNMSALPFTLPSSINTGFSSFNTPQINTDYKDDDNGDGKLGVLYNYCAVTAGTVCDSDSETSRDAHYDICPKGWKIPSGGDNGNYATLIAAYNNDASSVRGALHAVYAGGFKDDTHGDLSNGGIWSSTHASSGGIWGFYYGAQFVTRYWGSYRDTGWSVRCIAKAAEPETPHDIQDVTLATCPTTPTTVYDTRDGQAYTIAKLDDGNCWMLDNLNLGKRALKVLTPDDTNILSNFTLPASIDTGFNSYILPQINIDSRNDTSSYGAGENKTGVYYNYCAATAGTYCDASGTASGDAEEDICPKGWRLPTGGESGEYQNLISEYDDATTFKNTLRSALYGYFKNSSTNHIGSTGSFWSSTGVGDDHIYSLDVRANRVNQDYSSNRNAGISIRCIAKNGTEPERKLKMQQMTAATCPGDITTVVDSRDGEEYNVGLLADGNCWMLDNLRLDPETLTTTLNSSNTNMPANYTFELPASNSDFLTDSYTKPHIYTDNKDTTYGRYGPAGVYYNYCAASAGTYCYAASGGGNAYYDICPKGWRLPTDEENGELPALKAAYYGNTNPNFYNGFHRASAGYYSTSSLTYQGMDDFFWTSTMHNDYMMRTIYSDDIDPSSTTQTTRASGLSIRCVMKKPNDRASQLASMYIQDITKANCPTETSMVYDRRDNTPYAIQKLEDGNCWLLENLRLGLTDIVESLSTSNTNMSSSTPFTLPGNSSVWKYDTPQLTTVYANELMSYGSGNAIKGVLYNYCAASAGTYCYDTGDGPDGVSPYDICPKGWRMPTGGIGGEYEAIYLLNDSSIDAFRARTRITNTGTTNDYLSPTTGIYYSSTNTGGKNNAVYFRKVNSDLTLGFQYAFERKDGYSVRCVAK